MNILFVCSRNQWRSPTAETIYKNTPGVHAKSAGTSSSAKTKISAKLIQWAGVVFVMEKKHKVILTEKFPAETREKKIIVLDIPDEYKYMDEELVEQIISSVSPYLN